jgi:hypothetical protein
MMDEMPSRKSVPMSDDGCAERFERARRLALEVRDLLSACEDCERNRCFDAQLARALSRELAAQLEALAGSRAGDPTPVEAAASASRR